MTSRPRSAARRSGLPVAQLDSALMPLGDRECGEPIAETGSDALQVLAGARFAANFGQIRGGRFRGNEAVSPVGRGRLVLRIVLAAGGWQLAISGTEVPRIPGSLAGGGEMLVRRQKQGAGALGRTSSYAHFSRLVWTWTRSRTRGTTCCSK